MRILYATILVLSLLSTSADAMGGRKKPKLEGVQAWLAAERVSAINDMAGQIGLDPKAVLQARAVFKTCEHTDSTPDGPYVDGNKTSCAEMKASAHAWVRPTVNPIQYMFAIIGSKNETQKGIARWVVRHEVMHELILRHYGVNGHPTKVTITRKDNGKKQTFKPAEIIRGRWPSLINAVIPEAMESQEEWFDMMCGFDEVFNGDGDGI